MVFTVRNLYKGISTSENTKIFRKSKVPGFSDVFFCGIITVKYRVSHETLCFTGFDVRIWRVDDKKEQHI
jgi:hypothetical protein